MKCIRQIIDFNTDRLLPEQSVKIRQDLDMPDSISNWAAEAFLLAWGKSTSIIESFDEPYNTIDCSPAGIKAVIADAKERIASMTPEVFINAPNNTTQNCQEKSASFAVAGNAISSTESNKDSIGLCLKCSEPIDPTEFTDILCWLCKWKNGDHGGEGGGAGVGS